MAKAKVVNPEVVEKTEEKTTKEISVLVTETDLANVFVKSGATEAVIEKIKKQALSVVPDVETVKGRKEIKSLAYNVARAKTTLDNAGKAYVADIKEKVKIVDNERKAVRDALDELKDSVRGPLDDWEQAEEEQRQAEKEAFAAMQLAKEIEAAHDEALRENDYFDRMAELIRLEEEKKERDRVEKEEAERKAEEERIAREAVEAAEKLAEEEKARLLAEAQEAVREAERAAARQAEEEVERRLAEERAKQAEEREAAEAALREERAEKDRLIREQLEREAEEQRLADEAEAERAAEEKRLANKAHKGRINKAVAEAIEGLGVDGKTVRKIVKAIADGEIPRVSIEY